MKQKIIVQSSFLHRTNKHKEGLSLGNGLRPWFVRTQFDASQNIYINMIIFQDCKGWFYFHNWQGYVCEVFYPMPWVQVSSYWPHFTCLTLNHCNKWTKKGWSGTCLWFLALTTSKHYCSIPWMQQRVVYVIWGIQFGFLTQTAIITAKKTISFLFKKMLLLITNVSLCKGSFLDHTFLDILSTITKRVKLYNISIKASKY